MKLMMSKRKPITLQHGSWELERLYRSCSSMKIRHSSRCKTLPIVAPLVPLMSSMAYYCSISNCNAVFAAIRSPSVPYLLSFRVQLAECTTAGTAHVRERLGDARKC